MHDLDAHETKFEMAIQMINEDDNANEENNILVDNIQTMHEQR